MKSQSMNYETFLESVLNQKRYYSIENYDIVVYITNIIESLKKEFDFESWFLYSGKLTICLEFFSSSIGEDEKFNKIERFIFEVLPYVDNVRINKNDRRIYITFYEVDDPLKYKFYR